MKQTECDKCNKKFYGYGFYISENKYTKKVCFDCYIRHLEANRRLRTNRKV